MKSLVLVVVVAGIMVAAPVWAETVTGTVDVQDFGKVHSKWKFNMMNTNDRFEKKYKRTKKVKTLEKISKVKARGEEFAESRTDTTEKNVVWGAFYWCVNADKLPKVRFAYTYGERTEDQAWKKASYAFDAMEGRCNEKGVKTEVLSSNDL